MEKAGMGFGAMLEPDLLWRSLRVGLDCCLSLKAEKLTMYLRVLVALSQDAQFYLYNPNWRDLETNMCC